MPNTTLKRIFADVTTKKENEKLNEQNNEGKRKAALSSATAPSSFKKSKTTSTTSSTSLAISAEERKKMIENWGKAALRECSNTKLSEHEGRENFTVTVRDETKGTWTEQEFKEMFMGRGKGGRKKAPSKKMDPELAKVMTIMKFDNYNKLQKLFGEDNVHLIPTVGYKAQSIKVTGGVWDENNDLVGYWPARLRGLEVHFNKREGTLELKFLLMTGMCYDSLNEDPAALEDLKKTYTFVSGGPELFF